MLYWLANFISSEAFKHHHTVEAVLAVQPRSSQAYQVLEWVEGMLDRPVFPEWDVTGPKEKAKNPKSWGAQASAWAQRAGFRHYLLDLSTVDGTAYFLGLVPRGDLTEDFRSASMRRDPDLLFALPAGSKQAILARADYVAPTTLIDELDYRTEGGKRE
ncbi:hypothetical protein F4802DRAFT_603941 [Xylaria palmicola]|nr:hypothetical protein F4802DRAFT_603941 [Xylaria palmicola]